MKSERDAPSAYLQALADGCDFVVGPLTREEVASLATLADGRATTLALNFLPDGVQVPDRFYQFALSPEDEARLAARRIAADGRLSGVTLAPQSDWGRRVVAAFVEEFTAAGGRVVDQAEIEALCILELSGSVKAAIPAATGVPGGLGQARRAPARVDEVTRLGLRMLRHFVPREALAAKACF